MDLELTQEQQALQRSLRMLLEDHFPTAAVRACEADPAAATAIGERLHALGLGGMALSLKEGGPGLGMTGLAVVQVELGRALAPLAFTRSTVLAACLLAGNREPALAALRTAIVAGETLAGSALATEEGAEEVHLLEGADGARLTGQSALVCGQPDFLLVEATAQKGEMALSLVARPAAGVDETPLPNLAGMELYAVRFKETPVRAVVARGAAAVARREAALSTMQLAMAAQAVGGAEAALAMAQRYATTREQFGQPIGAFQAIAHGLAEAAVNVEGARILLYRAAAVADAGGPLGVWAVLAKLKACQVFRDVSALSVQVHGGIGFTLEADPQLYYRRAKHLQLMYGAPLTLEERAGEALLSGRHPVLEEA